MKPNTAQQPQPRGDVEVGDQIYIHHKGGTCCGRVLCHGQHGTTVDVDGAQHRVKWDKVLGHKQRIPMRFKVVEHGEDGMLVEDGQGKRRFMRVPPEARETDQLAKALSASQQPNHIKIMQNQREIILFFKAAPAGQQIQRQAPAAAAAEKPAAPAAGEDKAGGEGWAERPAGAGAPPDGQHVAFRNGEHRGHGQVKASGEHGVTIADSAGGEHRVRHEQVTHDWQGDGEPDQEPPADETSDEETLGGYDGKVALPGELIAKLLKDAPRELRAEVAEFLREKSAGADVQQKAEDATPIEPGEKQEKVAEK